MTIRLSFSQIGRLLPPVRISGSKSETNRALLLKALFGQIALENASDSDDSRAMEMALNSTDDIVDVHHAGTAMRFLTAYFASTPGRTVTLTGSARMRERPVGILVDALRELGADITYTGNPGFPPTRIVGKELSGGAISVKADVSSQFLSALLLIAPKLQNGLELTLDGELTSRPYLEMTLSLLDGIGVEATFEGSKIRVFPQSEISNPKIAIESDWSSTSYFYSIIALSSIGTEITLSVFNEDSLQGDSALAEIYRTFGVETEFLADSIRLVKQRIPSSAEIELFLNDTPDIAQTIAVTCLGLGIGCRLSGLHTLKVKETDRLSALKAELEKFGASVFIADASIEVISPSTLNQNISVKTYDDHRMAMAFAPLALKVPLVIEDSNVVTKSYPAFWEDMKRVGIVVA